MGKGDCSRPALDCPAMASSATQTCDNSQVLPQEPKQPRCARVALITQRCQPDKGHKINSLQFLAFALRKYKLNVKTLNYFGFTWRRSTLRSYTTHLRWSLWVYENDIPILNPEISNVLDFLRIYFETGVGYDAVNTARCALRLVLPRYEGKTMGKHFLVKWFCKSCYEE